MMQHSSFTMQKKAAAERQFSKRQKENVSSGIIPQQKGFVNMNMTDHEIYREWKEAKDQAKQVKILADENCCKQAKIIAIIGKMEAAEKPPVPAEEAPSKPAPAEPVPAEPVPAESDNLDKRLIELYKSGVTYKEMAAALSMPFSTIKYHIKKLTDSGEITNRVLRKNSKANAPEPEPELTSNAPLIIPADDMMHWLEVLRACVGMVEGGAKITHVCANDDSQAEVEFTANGNNYLLRVEVRR